MLTLNGVACEAVVVDPVGQADEEEDGADDHLGHDVKGWDGAEGDVHSALQCGVKRMVFIYCTNSRKR